MAPVLPVNQQLRRLRILAGLTQKEAAAKIGCNPTNITHWERGRTIPRMSRLKKIAEVYGCPIDNLIACLEGGANP